MPAKKSSSQGRQSRHTRLSMAAENYLLSIFRLEEQGQHVTMTRLGDHLKTLPIDEGLGISLPSVAAMIRRMGREGLVSSGSKKGVTLTRDGHKAAESIVRRHRLSERMVVDLLGMELERCHIETHRLEHAISPELEEKIPPGLAMSRPVRSDTPCPEAAILLPRTPSAWPPPLPDMSTWWTGCRRTIRRFWSTW
jgi:DtxR family Mn-dependent transcriptional regulator